MTLGTDVSNDDNEDSNIYTGGILAQDQFKTDFVNKAEAEDEKNGDDV